MGKHLKSLKSFVRDPKVRRYVKAASAAVEALSSVAPIKSIPLLFIPASVIRLANHYINPSNDPGNYLMGHVTSLGFKEISDGLGDFFLKQDFFTQQDAIKISGNWVYKIADVGPGSLAAVYCNDDPEVPIHLFCKGLSDKDVSDIFWEKFSHGVDVVNRKSSRNDSGLITIEESALDSREYLSLTHSPEALVSEIRRLHAAKASVSYCFAGPPGTGKTSFCIKVARLLGSRSLTISSGVLSNPNVFKELTKLIATVAPAVVIIDDIDSSGSEQSTLELISNIRKVSPQTVLMSTTNYWRRLSNGLKRPGRLGQRIDFLAPTRDERLKLISMYSKTFGINRDLSWMSDWMDHQLFTHDYVLDAVQKAAVFGDDELKAYIQQMVTYLQEQV